MGTPFIRFKSTSGHVTKDCGKYQTPMCINATFAMKTGVNNHNLIKFIGVRANFFSRGAEPSLPEKLCDSAPKTAMLTCKITLRDSTHPVIISKNPGFWALYLARRNEFRFFSFNKYKKYNFFHFWLLASARKI